MKPLRSVNIVGVLFVSILLILAFVTQSATAAWETHTDRPGMDYKSFWIDKDIEAFVAVKQCEDACKKDSQCKAFTYVNPGVQGTNARCYLKKGVPSPVKNTCCTSGVVKPESKADYCNNYALTAVQFSKSNTNWKCGYTGNRWSDNQKLHYDWCMKASESNSKYEANERKKLMDLCMKPSKSGDLAADDWCYNITTPGEITFYPIIKNVGPNHWKSKKEGYYKVGASVSSEIIEQKYTLHTFPHLHLQAYATSTLEGLALPYHPDNLYGIENIWTLQHPEDINKGNNLNLGLKGFYKGAAFKTDPTLLAKMCGNELLVIAHEDFLGALAPLKKHKDATGIQTHIESWQSLVRRFNGSDSPEKIKKGIADYKKKYGIRWVMLVGDSDRFPVRYVSRDVPLAQGYQASDLYYADLYKSNSNFDNWDGNGNDIYAQVLTTSKINNIDKVDWHPDVAVARVPTSTVIEVNNYVQKIISYELNAFNSPWFKRALLATGCDDCGDAVGISDYIATNYLSGFNIIKHYHTKTWQPYYPKHAPKGSTPAFITSMMDKRAKPMTDYINQGVGFINYYGHGSRDDFSWVYDSRHLNDLTNANKLPLIFSRACSTGEFAPYPPLNDYYDVNNAFHIGHWPAVGEIVPKPKSVQPGYGAVHNCDIEARPEDWLVYRNTGAIAFIGCAGTANPGHADQMNKDFFKAYKLGYKTFGDLWVYMIQRYLDGYGYFDKQGNILGKNEWENKAIWNVLVRFHAFGDPSLRIGGISGK
jgi:Peptidase family C25/PAN domain